MSERMSGGYEGRGVRPPRVVMDIEVGPEILEPKREYAPILVDQNAKDLAFWAEILFDTRVLRSHVKEDISIGFHPEGEYREDFILFTGEMNDKKEYKRFTILGLNESGLKINLSDPERPTAVDGLGKSLSQEDFYRYNSLIYKATTDRTLRVQVIQKTAQVAA
jgi:hypothetical protein